MHNYIYSSSCVRLYQPVFKQMKNIIVIGASAGGMAAINKIISGLQPEMDAAFLVVLHMSRNSNADNIAAIFQRQTNIPCHVANNNVQIEVGNLYLAQQDHHLMVSDGLIKINQGPHENRYRPSIDVLFRSAAVNYGNRAIGIILSGMLEDGTSGMWAIHNCGGVCVVQDPQDAEFEDMPKSVLNQIPVNHIAFASDIPTLLQHILANPLPAQTPIPKELEIEAYITEKMMSNIDWLKDIAAHSNFVCPDCGGGLWAIKNDPMHRYRCHTGHVYNEKILSEIQDEKIEESVWVSIRMLEEKLNLLLLQQQRADDSEQNRSLYYTRRVQDITTHITRLKKLLRMLHDSPHDAE